MHCMWSLSFEFCWNLLEDQAHRHWYMFPTYFQIQLCFIVIGCGVLYRSVRSRLLMLLRLCSLTDCLFFLNHKVTLWICLFLVCFVSYCFIYFEAMLLNAYKFRIIISSIGLTFFHHEISLSVYSNAFCLEVLMLSNCYITNNLKI